MNFTDSYQKAKQHGYSDDEILSHLSKSKPEFAEKMKKAKESGYSDEEIISHFNKTKEEESFLSAGKLLEKNIGNVGKDIAKGIIGGVTKLGRMTSPLEPYQKEQTPESFLEENLPSDKTFIGSSLKRGLEQAPTMLAFPGASIASILPKSIAAGFLGEGAKELGLPEWAQTAAELTAYIGPDVAKKLLESGKDGELIKFMRKFGLNDEQIAPLIQSEFKKKWLSKLAYKGESTKQALQASKEGLGEIYQSVGSSPLAAKEISEIQNGKLINGIRNVLNDLPREIQNKILPDLEDLINNKITGKTLMNFYKDINSKYSIPKKQLQLLKEPVKNALSSLSPELGKEFETVNQLYSKYADIASKLKPGTADELIKAAEAIGIAGGAIRGLFFGDFSYLAGIVGEAGIRRIAKHMLTNPNFQQLSRKMTLALNANKPALIQKTTQEMKSLVEKYDPELAEKIFSHVSKQKEDKSP